MKGGKSEKGEKSTFWILEMDEKIIKIGENLELSFKREFVGPLRPVRECQFNKNK